jgi:UDP-glucose 4-epimerase
VKALVTGGAGFIGSNLVDRLRAAGHEIAVVDDLTTGKRENLPDDVALHELSIVEADALSAAVRAEAPDVVFHLAAHIDVRRSVEDPAHDARVNVEGTVNVLRAAREAGARRVVLSSTGGAIYGEAEVIPTAEDAPIRPLAPYGQSKHAAEGYCALFSGLYGLSTIALRYANVYGPRQDPLGEGGVVAIFCGCLASGATPTIFGDGEQTRDFVYVGDVVEANLLAADSEQTGALNVASGLETSVLDLVERLRELEPDAQLAPRHADPRAGEVRRSCLDATRAQQLLDWAPRTDLTAGLRATLAHVASGVR